MPRRTPTLPPTPRAVNDPAATEPMPGPARIAAAAGFGWSLAFLAIGIGFDLQTYGDGAIFSYAIALRQAWEFHWHNIPGRLFSYAFALLPAETIVELTDSARAGIVAYGALHFSAPLLSLLLTRACDATEGRIFFRAATLSTALLCPFVFGFPTEMWMTHALFWPLLARLHAGRAGMGAMFATLALTQAFVLTHEGAIALLSTMLATLLVHRGSGRFARGIAVSAIAIAGWIVVKLSYPPDAYIADVLGAAAWKFIDPGNLTFPLPLLVATSLSGFAALAWTMRRLRPELPHAAMAAVTVAVALVAYWLTIDGSLHAQARYPVRTVLLFALPPFALCAAILAIDDEDLRASLRRWLVPLRILARTADAQRLLLGALALTSLVHGVETAKFAAGWAEYRSAIRRLATGDDADPALGDARFVSARRLAPALDRFSWDSTTPYLSVLIAPQMRPARLVVDPRAGYFWLSCDVARRSEAADANIPKESRALISRLACQHR